MRSESKTPFSNVITFSWRNLQLKVITFWAIQLKLITLWEEKGTKFVSSHNKMRIDDSSSHLMTTQSMTIRHELPEKVPIQYRLMKYGKRV